jgi:glutamate carboxypeptidase
MQPLPHHVRSGNAPDPARLLAYCEAEREWVVHLIESLALHESPSTDKEALDRLAAWLSGELARLGWEVETVRQPTAGNHLRAVIGTGPCQVLLLGHVDTVWPLGQLERMPVRTDRGRLYGPGVFDMKAGIAVALLAMRAVRALYGEPSLRVVLLLTSDEEIGSASSRSLIEAQADESLAVLVLEPSLPGGAVKTCRKGVGELVIEAHGIAAHAGIEPERGASAIVELAHQVLALRHLQEALDGVTLTVGRVEGGLRSNVVPDRARAEVDVRVSTAAAGDRLMQALGRLSSVDPRVRLQISGGLNRPPLERTPAVARLYQIARAAAAELGLDLGEGATGGASDGNFTAARGVPTLDGLGPCGGGAHALDEHVELAGLAARAALIASLLMRFADQDGGAKRV